MKSKSCRKSNIISIRMNDDELDFIQRMMDTKDKKASSIMREAFSLLIEKWEMSRRMERV